VPSERGAVRRPAEPEEHTTELPDRRSVSYQQEKAQRLQSERVRREVRAELDAQEAGDSEIGSAIFTGAVTGDDFVFGLDAELGVVWGQPDSTAWAAGEAMMIFAPQGCGKTTLAMQLMKGRIGLLEEVLGMPVIAGKARTLYLAGDRPRQAARAMRRLFRGLDPTERATLQNKLVVWKGPLPFDLTQHPSMLNEMAQHYGCDTIFIDSIKDVVSRLNDDECGSLYNRAVQHCLVAGIEVCDLHHPRKASSDNSSRPKGIDDIYGSTWLTAGHGSIISLWGKTGDLVVELTQLKMVNDEVGPFTVEHDHDLGMSSVLGQFDLLGALVRAGELTALRAAALMFAVAAPTPDQKARARRALQALVKSDLAVEHAGAAGGVNGGTATTWVPVKQAGAASGAAAAAAPRTAAGGPCLLRPDIF